MKTKAVYDLRSEMENTSNRLKVIKEMMEKEETSYSFINDIAKCTMKEKMFHDLNLLVDDTTPEEIVLGGFKCKLKKEGNKMIYKGSNEENYLVTISYSPKSKLYQIEILPGYNNVFEILEQGLEPLQYCSTFTIESNTQSRIDEFDEKIYKENLEKIDWEKLGDELPDF